MFKAIGRIIDMITTQIYSKKLGMNQNNVHSMFQKIQID